MQMQSRVASRLSAALPLALLLAADAGAASIETLLHPFTGDDTEVRIILDDASDPGAIEVRIEVTGAIGDIRGVFFDFVNDALLGGLSVTGEHLTSYSIDSVRGQGPGNNLNGGGSPCPCDLGIEIGTPGIGVDDIQATTLWITHADGLDLAAFSGQDVGVRLTSVGSNREGSSKLGGVVPEPSTAALLGMGLIGASLAQRTRRQRTSR